MTNMRCLPLVLVAAAILLAAVALAHLHTPAPTPYRYPSRGNCLLKEKTLERFKYVTFYSWHPARNLSDHGKWDKLQWAQMGQESVIPDLVKWHNVTGRSSMLEIQGALYEPIPFNKSNISPHTGRPITGFQVRADWRESWDQVVAALKKDQLVERGIITGFMLGDELIWNNITWDQLNYTSAYVKKTVPAAYIMYTEGSGPMWGRFNKNHYHVEYPHVCNAIDYFSFDDYAGLYGHPFHNDDAWHQYHYYIYDRHLLLPHQSVWIIPPAWGGACPQNISNQQPACDEYLLNQTYGWLDWVDEDEHITGSDAFHTGTFDHGLLHQNRTLACWKQLSAQVIEYQKKHNVSLGAPRRG